MGRRHRFTMAIVTAILFSVLHPAFGETETGIPEKAEPLLEQLVIPLQRAPETLNPYLAWDGGEKLINRLVYESLLSVDPSTGKISPGLARQWKVEEENLLYTFSLKTGVRWHDGMPFTAGDVVFSFEKLLDPGTDDAHIRSSFLDIEEIVQVDDSTVRFRLERPYYLALEALGGLPIIPRHLFEEGDFNRSFDNSPPVGTGPYKFGTTRRSGRIVLQANEDYHGPPPPARKIVFTIADEGGGGGSYIADMASFSPLQWVMGGGSAGSLIRPAGEGAGLSSGKRAGSGQNAVAKEKGYRPLPPVDTGFSSIMLNLSKPVFWDQKVRRALAHLVDREHILNTVLLGYGRFVESSFPIEGRYYNGDIEPFTYDLDTARTLLTEAGWEDNDGDGVREKGSIKLSVRLYADEGWRTGLKMAAIIGQAMGRAGIKVRIEKVEGDEFLARLRTGAFDAALVRLETTDYTDPYQLWHSSQAGPGYNFPRLVNAEVDYLLERARLEDDSSRRLKYYRRLQQVVHDEVPAIFLFSHQALWAVSPRLQKLNMGPEELFSLLTGRRR